METMESAAVVAGTSAATAVHLANQSDAASGCIVASGIEVLHATSPLDRQQQMQHQQYQRMEDCHDKSPVSICSDNTSTSDSTSSSTTTSSAPQYTDDLRRAVPMLDLLQRQGSTASTKTCEVDLGDEERDTYSPISSSNSPSDAECSGGNVVAVPSGSSGMVGAILYNGDGGGNGGAPSSSVRVDNKVYDVSTLQPLTKLKASSAGIGSNNLPSTTKEEKQRQNEEIVIMETSSISSETGSWESVFPHTAVTTVAVAVSMPSTSANVCSSSDVDLLSRCTEFLENERREQHVKHVSLDRQQPTKEKHTSDVAPRDECNLGLPKESAGVTPYLRERTYSTDATMNANTSSLFTGGSTSSLLRELDKRENALTTSGTSACFIDASSLRDEDEVLSFPSLDGHQSNDELGDAHELVELTDHDDESPTKKLETFHMSFAKCKAKSKELIETSQTLDISNSSSSSNSGGDSPQKGDSGGGGISVASATSTNNLSDEEKLWKREHDTQNDPSKCDTKGQCGDKDAQPDVQQQQQNVFSCHEDATEASVSLAADVDSSDSSEIVKLRREQERKQSPYVFQHNTQHFNIYPLGVSPKFSSNSVAHTTNTSTITTTNNNTMLPNAPHAAHSDLSYTTDYSSSSPAPSLVWSEHEHRPSGSGRHQTIDDYDGGHLYQKPCLLPDTPHNSIVHIDPVSSNTSSIHRDYTLSSSLSHQRDSGAYCSDATDSPIPMPRTPKRSKFDEANPIVSGGASFKDFNVKQCESPPITRRTDTCPIMSGGFVSLDFESTRPLAEDDDEDVELRAKPKLRKPLSGIASWVVDMSDCRPERRKSTSSNSSMEATGPTALTKCVRERSDSTSSHKSSCGFYVSLDSMDKKPDDLNTDKIKHITPQMMSKSYTAPKPTGFFVNLSKSEYQPKEIKLQSTEVKQIAEEADKKNIFSMFIDFGDKKPGGANGKKEPFSLAQRLSSSFTSSQRRAEDAMKSSASSTETLMSKSNNFKTTADSIESVGTSGESKSLDYRCNIEAPITVAAIRRISQQQRAQSEAVKRHSWSNNQAKDGTAHEYKRSISLTTNGENKDGTSNGNGLMSIIDKLPLISKTSSLSVDSSLSPYDEYMGSKSELSSYSNNSALNSMSGGEREEDAANPNATATARLKKRRRDVQINETFDKSSLASITDGILSKDLSPASTTDTDDLTFQQDEELAIREAALQQQPTSAQISASNRSSAIIMETIIEAKETSSPKKNASGHTMESLHATIEKQKMLLETVNEHGDIEKSSFVKLSDMDKPVKFELHSPEAMMSKSVGNHRQINRLFRDETKATRPHSWSMTRSTGNSFLNITNSVDNLRSLSRLFPNFSKEFSNSLPNDMILDQMDYIQTDISGDSSLASSFSRSGMDESSISCRQPRRLGEDLLKMFLQEIATDMIVEVHGRRIKAHKCILRSRCQYFAAMLAGHGAQSVVSLQGYSYSSVHFALCHIYSGASHPPDGISLMELAALADLLGLEGLKEVTAHALKTNYCHNFHKPCSGCIDGILQVLPVALNHALDDLYRKCLRWTCRHYIKVWPTRQFAQMPADILGRCRQQIVAYLTSESVLDTVLDCDNLLAQLVSFRWGGICENLVRDILDSAYTYVSDHFASLVASDAFLSLGHDHSCHIPRLEGLLLRTASSLTPDQACRSYQRVTRLNTVLQAKVIQMPVNLGLDLAKELQGLQEENLNWAPEYIRLVSAILSAVEQCLIRQCSRAMRITAWQRMDLDLRKKIQTLARLTEPLDMKRNSNGSSSSKPVSKAFSFGGSTRNQDLYQVKLAIQAHSKRALAQDTQLYKATQTTQEAGVNVQTTERGVQANHDLREGTSKVLKSNSRAHVPQSTYRASSQSAIAVSERNNVNTHRRTQSEAPLPSSSNISNYSNNKKSVFVAAATHTSRTTETKAELAKQKACADAQSQSHAQAPQAAAVPPPARLVDVRPRYLEPRKTRGLTATNAGPVRSATSSSITASGKGKVNHRQHISSSDSSRNSSPAAVRRAAAAKIGNKSSNMSLDSLANATARNSQNAPRAKSSDNERFSDLGADSLAESMKSSVMTNKTVSHESLPKGGGSKLTRSQPLSGNNKYAAAQRLAQSGNNKAAAGSVKSCRAMSLLGGGRAQRQQHITSNGSSLSSVTTTKSATSRLSSVSSTHSSRDLYKQRSISVPAAADTAANNTTTAGQSTRRSFLSAKSREILAKRAEKNKQQQSSASATTANHNSSGDEQFQRSANASLPPLRSASHSAITSTSATMHNRNSLPSNIPTRRPNTLQLKKTTNGLNNANHKLNIVQQQQRHQDSNKSGAGGGVGGGKMFANVNSGHHQLLKAAKHAVRQKIELLIDTSKPAATCGEGGDAAGQLESKLERSSTFCKESSDLDMNELQIIE